MCAGISFSIDKINPKELDIYFTKEEFEKQRKADKVLTFFWQEHPFLPIEEEDGTHLYKWGSRDKNLKLPRTGWAQIESVRDGRWDWLSPKIVNIPSLSGYEKKKWFATPHGIKGLKIRYHNLVRVYLLTTRATQEYLTFTNHDRMPVFNNK